MKNGDVIDFLNRMDLNGWTVLYQGYGYYIQSIWNEKNNKFHIEIQKNKAHTLDHINLIDEKDVDGHFLDYQVIELDEFDSYEEARKDFVSQKIWCDNTKSFWEVQEDMEWLD